MKIKLAKIVSLAIASAVLASCSSIEKPNIPQDYTGEVGVIQGESGSADVNFNTKDQYYKSFTDQNDAMLNNLLLQIASKVSNGGITDRKTGNALSFDSSVEGDSQESRIGTYYGANGAKGELTFPNLGQEFTERGQKALGDKIKGGTYNYNDRFDENKLIEELDKELLLDADKLKDASGNPARTTMNYAQMRVINKTTAYEDLFKDPSGAVQAGTADYSTYIRDYLLPDIARNKLIAQYIYNERFTNIALDQMQKLEVLNLKDRTDVTGAARKFINAYYARFSTDGPVVTEAENAALNAYYRAHPLAEMERLWNGIGAYNDTTVQGYVDQDKAANGKLLRHGWSTQFDNYLTESQKTWLVTNSVDTLFDQIMDNYKKAYERTDEAQFDSFSATRTQDIQKGLVTQINGLLKADIRQEGIFTKSSLSDVDSTVTDRVFTQFQSEDQLLKPFVGTDLNAQGALKFYYPTTSESAVSAPAFYASGTYTFVMLETNYNAATLGTGVSDNRAKGAAAVTAAMDAAYQMVSESSYKTDSTVYWIKNFVGRELKFDVNNQSFYDYLKGSYPDLFDDAK